MGVIPRWNLCKFVRTSNPSTMKNMNAFLLLGAMLTTALFTSCGSLEITKRRHMPGYHVELNNGKQHQLADRDQAHAKEQPARSTKEMEVIEVKSSTV